MLNVYIYSVYFDNEKSINKINLTEARKRALVSLFDMKELNAVSKGLISELSDDKYFITIAPNFIKIESKHDYDMVKFCKAIEVFGKTSEVTNTLFSLKLIQTFESFDDAGETINKIICENLNDNSLFFYTVSFLFKYNGSILNINIELSDSDDDFSAIIMTSQLANNKNECHTEQDNFKKIQEAYNSENIKSIKNMIEGLGK